jgi:hypothetical protein
MGMILTPLRLERTELSNHVVFFAGALTITHCLISFLQDHIMIQEV